METRLVDALLKYRYAFFIFGLIITSALATGFKDLYVDADYRSFFFDDDPQLVAYDNIQNQYTKSESLNLLIGSKSGAIFTPSNIETIYELTEELWHAPYAIRVDSITNFQYSTGDQEGLIVEDFISSPDELDAEALEEKLQLALAHKQLINRMISTDGKATLLAVSMDIPEIDPDSSLEQQMNDQALRQASFSETGDYAAKIKGEIEAQNPDLVVHAFGPPVVNNTLNASTERDATTLIPLMYGLIALTLWFFLRSIGSVFGAIVVVALSTIGGVGSAGLLGVPITTMTIISPIIILTIAVCDAVHLQVIYLRNLALGLTPLEAMRKSLQVNLHPIILTSVTTAIGFITLNYADSPNITNLGNISAIGVTLAMVLTLTMLPTISLLLVKKSSLKTNNVSLDFVANLVINRSKTTFTIAILTGIFLISMVPLNTIDDDPATYFDAGVPYRDAIDYAQTTLPAVKNVDFSLSCGSANCVHEPSYQKSLKEFTDWATKQDGVIFVNSYVDVITRLNMNMHGDAAVYERLPSTRELASQYHLLYEMSLPEGLDLNNQISYDQSSSRVNVLLKRINTSRLLEFEAEAQQWLEQNAPELKTPGASVYLMFATLGEKSIRSMFFGGIIAMIAVTLTILVAIKSIKYGLLSMIPNAFPALMALGVWGLTVGTINMAGAVVFSFTLGLVVDNTVHFMSKYMRYLKDTDGQAINQSEQTNGAIHYAFSTVGPALLVTTGVLATGFALLTVSDLNINAYMGALTAMTIVIALVFDFLVLPSLLKIVDR